MRRLLVATALAGLLAASAVIAYEQLTGDDTRMVPVAGASPFAEVWRTRVRFDFAQGLAGPVIEKSNQQLALTETTEGGGSLIQMPRGDGWAIHFPARCHVDASKCPRAILESGPAGLLNPGTRAIRWGASVQMMPNETSEGGNVLQKGLAAAGTQFKLQVDGLEGRPSCVVAGAEGIFLALSSVPIADGKWHDLACERHKTLLTIYVDGLRTGDVAVPAGLSIVNDAPLRLGGKGHGPYNDQFHGTIDDVFVEIA